MEKLMKYLQKPSKAQLAFSVHPTKKHSEQDPFPDHLTGMWFCLREEVVSCVEGRNVIHHFPLDGSGPKEIQLPKKCYDIYKKGCEKVTKEFNGKLHECFPSVQHVGST